MSKTCLLFLLLLSCITLQAQEPYIATAGGDGLGQYGYLEKDAVTFSRLERNTHNNVAFLSARWWVTDHMPANGEGKEFIYHVYDGPDWITGIGWQCGGDNYPSKRTTDFTAADFSPEWAAGSDCYVSVCAKYCDDTFSPASFDGTSTNGAIGFNERHFSVVDVDTSLHASTATYIANAGGNCQTSNAFNVAGSFTITPGNLGGISLTTLLLRNSGTAQEGTDIPNSAFHVYYEPAASGMEIFGDGNEIFAGTLNGVWDGNATDNIFGSTSLSIPLAGKLRVYILLCEYNSAAAIGKVINLGIINDGIHLAPALDGFTKLRINAGSISQRNIVLPLQFTSFAGRNDQGSIRLTWTVSNADHRDVFKVETSANGEQFTEITSKPSNDFKELSAYHFRFNSGAAYFRITGVSPDGILVKSKTLFLPASRTKKMVLLENPVHGVIHLRFEGRSERLRVEIFDVRGKLLSQQDKFFDTGVHEIGLPHSAPGMQWLRVTDQLGQIQNFRIYNH